ncbi:hypothetical protein CBR_g4386 [Chara braunii]|uniref:Uncharacterized protein n=1 Tax=Chara braunii TaxID=69332 RepID=A0A388KHM9_CHABU|nr:hypothetical protein CBR_g4386 [Chara braunii]|eukprot:GBG69552.1 hypothetical protein CBR_g4386 [Chara braunii]
MSCQRRWRRLRHERNGFGHVSTCARSSVHARARGRGPDIMGTCAATSASDATSSSMDATPPSSCVLAWSRSWYNGNPNPNLVQWEPGTRTWYSGNPNLVQWEDEPGTMGTGNSNLVQWEPEPGTMGGRTWYNGNPNPNLVQWELEPGTMGTRTWYNVKTNLVQWEPGTGTMGRRTSYNGNPELVQWEGEPGTMGIRIC